MYAVAERAVRAGAPAAFDALAAVHQYRVVTPRHAPAAGPGERLMQRGFDPAVGHDHGAGGARAGINGVILRKTKQAVSKIIRSLDDVIAIVIGVQIVAL